MGDYAEKIVNVKNVKRFNPTKYTRLDSTTRPFHLEEDDDEEQDNTKKSQQTVTATVTDNSKTQTTEQDGTTQLDSSELNRLLADSEYEEAPDILGTGTEDNKDLNGDTPYSPPVEIQFDAIPPREIITPRNRTFPKKLRNDFITDFSNSDTEPE